MPFAFRLYEAPAYNKAGAVAFLYGVPNGVRKDLLGAPADKLQLTSKGAVLADEWETLDYSILKLTEAVKFLEFDGQLDFIPSSVIRMRWKTIDRSSLAGVLSCEEGSLNILAPLQWARVPQTT